MFLPAGASALTPVPVILMTHGGGQDISRLDSDENQYPVFDGLLNRGYAILAWDTRGMGQSVSMSGGQKQWFGAVRYHGSDPSLEGADAGALIDFLGGCPQIQQDGPGDPRVGWTGGSNGGLQLLTRANDTRLDALAPFMLSADLDRDFFPNGVAKEWWNQLYRTAWGYGSSWYLGSPNPAPTSTIRAAVADQFHRAYPAISGGATAGTGVLTQELGQFLRAEAVLSRGASIKAPTIVVQGIADTGAPLENAFALYSILKSAPAQPPFRVIVACMGHSLFPSPKCPYAVGSHTNPDHAHWQSAIFSWMDRWLKGAAVPDAPEFEWQDQDLVYRTATGDPLSTRHILGVGTPYGVPAGKDDRVLLWPGGGASYLPKGGDIVDVAARAPVTTEQNVNYAVNWSVLSSPSSPLVCTPLVGTPTLRVTGKATLADGFTPLSSSTRGFAFAELIDTAPGYIGATLGRIATALAFPPTGFETGAVSY